MTEDRSTKDLFKAWRGGDAAAGQLMAEQIVFWYNTIATSRLGQSRGTAPCNAASQRFIDDIMQVTESRALVKWAHDIVVDEVNAAGGVARDGDEMNAYTDKQQPKALLARAKTALPTEVAILEAVYGGKMSEAQVEALAAPLGGNPIGVLTARYSVKRWLRDNASIPFSVTPEEPILDRAPLPQYESAHMNDDEVIAFEQWMLTDVDLCQDIAEFSTYAVALRGGLNGAKSASAPKKRKASTVPTVARTTHPDSPPVNSTVANAGKGIAIAAAVVAALVVFLLIGAVVVFQLS